MKNKGIKGVINMKYLENNKIKNDVIDMLIDKLNEYEDNEYYSCDLACYLLEQENIYGNIFSTEIENIKYINNNFYYFGEIVEELILSLGAENVPNVFLKPCAFIIMIYLEVADYLISQCQYIKDNWNDKLVLDENIIEILTKQLEDQRVK